jgi:hypothetical protein
MPYDGGELVRLIADASVVADRDPSFSADGFQPDLVRTVRREAIAVPPDF